MSSDKPIEIYCIWKDGKPMPGSCGVRFKSSSVERLEAHDDGSRTVHLRGRGSYHVSPHRREDISMLDALDLPRGDR